jgi:hypothetical protein
MALPDFAYLDFALQILRPTAEYTFNDADYSTIKWIKLEGEAPTMAEIDAAIAQIKADEIAAKAKAATDKAALLAKLGITADEARLLLS